MSAGKGRSPSDPKPGIASQPATEIEAVFQRALALHRQGQIGPAESLYKEILDKAPAHFGALHYLGVIEGQKRNYGAAVALIERALAIDPTSAPACNNLGTFLRKLGRNGDALASFDRALAIKPDHAEALHNRGNALRQLQRHEDALESYDRALAVKPDYAEALYSRGNVLIDLRRPTEALASYERALAIRPGFADALLNRAYALLELKRNEEAVACYGQALAIKPDFPEALYNRGIALTVTKQYEQAISDFEQVLRLDPEYPCVKGKLIHAKLDCCDWRSYERDVATIEADIRSGRRICEPFTFMALSDSADDQLRCTRTYAAEACPAAPNAMWRGERYGHKRIRVAYLSADFRDHPIAYLMAGLFDYHDRSRFEPIAISFGPNGDGEMRERLKGAFERFIDVGQKGDREVAKLVRDLEADIAVDLMGYTTDSRPRILAFRPAPVQVNYLGYPGTMGADHIDYILADRIVIPDEARRHYSEKVVYLPDTYQANDSKKRVGDRIPTRAEAGLPETGFVFCSFNNLYKIAPHVFTIWMRLLRDVESSVLWLLEGAAAAVGNLRREADARGISPDRLVFAPRVKLEDYLARYRLADLFLDTLPYNAGSTASDALWAGLPVVTCLGASFAGRMAGSLLTAVGLPDLVSRSWDDYETLARTLARDTDMLSTVRARLAQNRRTHPLFDTGRFCRHIEAAYAAMHGRSMRGEPPKSFDVDPNG